MRSKITVRMDKAIKISVSKLDPYKSVDFKELFRQTVDWLSDLSFDYNMTEKALRILFPGPWFYCLI